MPALKIAAEHMLTSEAVVEKFKQTPLSLKTIARRIQDMSHDIKSQLIECFNDHRKWAIQLNESTDIRGKAQLLSFLRFVRRERIVNEFFFDKNCDRQRLVKTGELHQLLLGWSSSDARPP